MWSVGGKVGFMGRKKLDASASVIAEWVKIFPHCTQMSAQLGIVDITGANASTDVHESHYFR